MSDPASKFEVGKTYATRSIGDHDCNFSFAILARTAKTVTIKVDGQVARRGLSIFEGRASNAPAIFLAASFDRYDNRMRTRTGRLRPSFAHIVTTRWP